MEEKIEKENNLLKDSYSLNYGESEKSLLSVLSPSEMWF
jgi:hypothetical protein